MHIPRLATVFAGLISLFIAGCPNHTQRNIKEDRLSANEQGNGVIVGSVTAPFNKHYHETMLFTYRSAGDDGKQTGVLTSGIQHGNPLIEIPTCSNSDFPQQCGRLFAVSLPAGNYEIYEAEFLGRHLFRAPPFRFNVTNGVVRYIGNLHVSFCVGLVRSTRGNILGANVSVRDQYEKDVALIRKRFSALRMVSIDKLLLPDPAWRMRVSYDPFDWGECSLP